jgi:hypothetical protein
MPRLTLVPRAGLALGIILCTGCQTRVAPTSAPTGSTAARPADRAGPAANGQTPVSSLASRPAAAVPPAKAKAPLRIAPEASTIAADDLGLQLLLSRGEDGEARDLTAKAMWTADPPGLARVDQSGYVRPLQGGKVTVRATIDGEAAAAVITLGGRGQRSWDFGQDIVPVLTRAGCNTGSCHGRADGQNGFHLSLFGYDPAGDYLALARDAGQRRLSRFAPEESLFLAKATGRVAHVGGARFLVGSPEYETLLGWIKDGARERAGKTHGDLVKVTVEPGSDRQKEPGPRQIRVVAHFADGHERDVTRLASFRVNDDSAAAVSQQGAAVLKTRAETDVIVRYQSQILNVRLSAVINPDLKFDFSTVKRRNFIDDELFKRLESLKVPPSPPASDAAFLRRASLDLTGEQPAPDEIRRFLADSDPDKRIKLIDRLIKKHDFVLFWRIKFGDLLQISTARQNNGAYRYQTWIDNCLAKNRPWDDVVRTLLTATGDPNDIDTGGPVNYAVDALEPNVAAELTAQRFLGIRLRCAQCHNHPFDVWTQDDYFGLAALFAKVKQGGGAMGMMASRPAITINPDGKVIHLRTKKPASPRLLDGKPVATAPKEDPRKVLAAWMTAADNPYFARAVCNWAWAQLFGKGLVDPADDMSRANPPVHPELLDALARNFIAHKFDLRDLIRTIASSEAYGLSSSPVPGNKDDMRLFSHQIPRPLTAHQMADALAQATDVPNRFENDAARTYRRAIEVADPTKSNTILDTFGRCDRTATCATTSAPPLSLRQALLLIGGDVIDSKVTSLNGYLTSALKLDLEPEELVENLYFRTVCRPPTAEELSHWAAELKGASSRREAAEDLFWSLLNSREFAFNH